MPKRELNNYAVGLMRLHEMAIARENFSDDDIAYIGFCSIQRIEVIICKVGNSWGVRGRMETQLLQFESVYGYHGHVKAYYRIYGKKVYSFHRHYAGTAEELMKAYNGRPTYCKPISEMNHKEIFAAAKGAKPSRRNAPKMRSKERIANAIRMEKL